MARAYTYSTREIEKMLQEKGYQCVRKSGSHKIYSNGTQTAVIKKDLNKMIALRIIKECGLDATKDK